MAADIKKLKEDFAGLSAAVDAAAKRTKEDVDELKRIDADHQSQIDALKAQLAQGTPVSQEDLDTLAALLAVSRAKVDAIDPLPNFPPPTEG